MTVSVPRSILIIGSGVFGLSTAFELAQRAEFKHTTITVIDRVSFPAPDAGSVDSSRLVRVDYADFPYAELAKEALRRWRGDFGKEGRYTESGFAVLVNDDGDPSADAAVKSMLDNVQKLGAKLGTQEEGAEVVVLEDREAVKKALPGFSGYAADRGYINYTSGWAHAENGLRYLRTQAEALNRIEFRVAEIRSLLFDRAASKIRVAGAETVSGEHITADMTILAAGAWSGQFIDLRGIASATGQPLAYVKISDEEQTQLLKNPAIINPSNYMYIIQPRDNVLKVARHSYGWSNPQTIKHPEKPGETMTVSLPRTKHDQPDLNIPAEGDKACRDYLTQCMPEFKERPWLHTRICWYSDTRYGDWLIDYHPQYEGLFVSTGDSGHGYKFLPVIGERIVDVILEKPRGALGEELSNRWKWPHERGPLDYAWTEELRGGPKGMILDEQLAKQ